MNIPNEIERLPRFEQSTRGVPLAQRGRWEYSTPKNHRGYYEVQCIIEVRGTVQADSHLRQETEGYWRLGIVRQVVQRANSRTLAKTFVATVKNCFYANLPGSTDGVDVAKGWCDDWRDAVYMTVEQADVPSALRRFGATVYRPDSFDMFRPFVVKYPYRDPKEPNALYSPFTLVGDHEFSEVTDGAHSCTLTGFQMRAAARNLGANAFLRGPDHEGRYFVHHREDMKHADSISIDDWRARIIAGAADNF